jgi:hypothetical protein
MSPELRKAVYTAVAGVLALLVVLGVVDEPTADSILDSVDKVAAIAALWLARRHVTPPAPPTSPPAGELEERYPGEFA